VWQRREERRREEFQLLGVAQAASGEAAVRPVVQEWGVTFPVLLDRQSLFGRLLGFRVVPAAFFVDAGGILRSRHNNDFDIGEPRDRHNLERFLAGERVVAVSEDERMLRARWSCSPTVSCCSARGFETKRS
jgi:hypothetical protein